MSDSCYIVTQVD